MESEFFQFVQGNWEIGFLYLIKVLSDGTKKGLDLFTKYLEKKDNHMEQILSGLQDLKVLVQVHETEIKNLKKSTE